jgi:SAM-dependent methyltransferase
MTARPRSFDTLYEDGRREGLDDHVIQWTCRASLAQYRLVYAITREVVSRGTHVLDWGCGNGHFSYFLAALGARVEAFSFDPPPPFMVGREGYRHHRGDPTEPRHLPFEADRFEVVVSVGVLEHVYETGGDERASLREIHRVLAPGGRFLCFHFPNRHGWIEPAGKAVGRLEHYHHRKYDRGDIQRLCRETDLELLSLGRYNMIPRNQMRKLPAPVVDSRGGVATINAVDDTLRAFLGKFAQNYYFVGRKPA